MTPDASRLESSPRQHPATRGVFVRSPASPPPPAPSLSAFAPATPKQIASKSPDDVVVVSALRTPITRARKGGLKDTPADDLLATLLRASVAATGLNPADVGDVVVGSVLGNSSQRANECRIGMFLAGFPETVPVRTVNRQCSSGLQAVADVAASIAAGFYDVGVAAGVETMTANPMKWEGGMNPRVASSSAAQSCLIPMGVTSENVAEKWRISRQTQDSFSARSHARAAAARASGRFDSQIVPVHTTWKDPKTGEVRDVRVTEDDGIRENVTLEALAKLPAVFKKGGSTTPGNASQISDGAGCVVLARRSYAEREGLPILARFVSFAAVGVDPKVMGIGPAVAIPEAARKAGIAVADVELFELNEAFASQATYCAEKLGLDHERVNVNGGAIALGHPLGATGARCVATLLHEMRRTGKSTGVVSMCIGSGMGAAGVFAAE